MLKSKRQREMKVKVQVGEQIVEATSITAFKAEMKEIFGALMKLKEAGDPNPTYKGMTLANFQKINYVQLEISQDGEIIDGIPRKRRRPKKL